MKHHKLAADPNVIEATAGHDFFYIHPGQTLTINGFIHDQDFIVFDSGTGVYDGILPWLLDLGDGVTFSNSHGTASWVESIGDHNGDGILDTHFDMIVGGVVIGGVELLGVSNITSADILGG